MTAGPRFGVVAAWLGLICFTGCSNSPKSVPTPSQPESPRTESIPLDLVYSTNGQKGLKAVSTADANYGRRLKEIADEFRSGASDVYLVWGRDFPEVVLSTWFATGGLGHDGQPVKGADTDDRRQQLWLTAYLGTAGSAPPAWQVKAIERTGNTVRLAYRKGQAARVKDRHQYFVWAPLGVREAGRYRLELYDEGDQEVTFSRHVTVPRPKESAPVPDEAEQGKQQKTEKKP